MERSQPQGSARQRGTVARYSRRSPRPMKNPADRSEGIARSDLAFDLLWDKILKEQVQAIGREQGEDELCAIPNNVFEKAQFEWDEGGTVYSGNVEYKDIWIRFDDLEREFPTTVNEETNEVGSALSSTNVVALDRTVTKRGRPPKYNWDEFYVEIIRLANGIDGVPETQAELEATMAEWCQNNWGTEPAESTIRDKISPIYKAIRKAENY